MPLFEVNFHYSLEGEDSAIISAASKKEAIRLFQEKFNHFRQTEVNPDAIFIEPTTCEQWGFQRNNNSDDYEIIA